MPDSQYQGLYPKKVIADLFNLSERRIEQLVQKKIIPKAGRGVFDLGPTVQAYIRYLQGVCSGAIHTEPSELEQRLLMARVTEKEAKARQAQYRADAMEIMLHISRGAINSADGKLRAEILKIPKQLSSCFPDPEISADVEREANALIVKMLSGGGEP